MESHSVERQPVHVQAAAPPSIVDEVWGEMTSEAIHHRALHNQPNNVLLRHPLFRRLYLLFFVLFTLFFLLPCWTLLYIPKRNRPRSSWSLRKCLRVRWSRRLCAVVARCEIDYLGRDLNRQLNPLKLEHCHQVIIPPAPEYMLLGHPKEALVHLHASRGRWYPLFVRRLQRHRRGAFGKWNPEHLETYGFAHVPAFWYTGPKVCPTDPPRPRAPGQPVMLHFHGGGYLCGTAAETDLTSSIPKSLVVYSPVHHILSVDYRLAPNAPWPLPLLDAISAYHHLVRDQHIPERDIVISGDSAGGHLAMALTRWLRDEGARVGFNGARGLVVMSPWCDLGFTNLWGPDKFNFNAEADSIDNTFGPFAASLLLRALPPKTMHETPYISPASQFIPATPTGPNSFEGFPPTFVTFGDSERLATEIEVFWDRLQLARKFSPRAVPDVILSGTDAVHDFCIFPWFAEEAAIVYEQLDGWLRQLLAADADEGEEDEETLSSEEAASPDWRNIVLRRRESRKLERESLKTGKSPVMIPRCDTTDALSMVGDMQAEGMSMIDLPPLDLDSFSLPSSEAAREWVTPFTSQYERGEWDWEDNGRSWYEIENEEESESDDEGGRKVYQGGRDESRKRR